MTFKEKIVKLRKLKGLTQDDFASAVGVSRQAVYKWESGQSYPEVAKLLEIKKLFDISIDDLLDESYEVVLPEKKKRKRLPKEVKENLEAETLLTEDPALEATPTAEEAATVEEKPEASAAPAAEEVSAIEEAPVEEAPAEEESSAEEDGKKKVGFFGRIFGRK